MLYNAIFIPFLLILFIFSAHVYSHITLSKDAIIAHPETGLFIDYVGQYTPSQAIIHNSAIFPMTRSSCYFLPLAAASNIPLCNVTSKRQKRLALSVVSLGVATVSLAKSTYNSIQIGHLQRQVAVVENTLSTLSQTVQIHGAQLAKLTSKYIELAEELHETQEVLNDMIPILYEHSVAINDLKTGLHELRVQLQQSFLYLAITQICRNEFTLGFLSPEDIHKVVYNVIERGNITFNHDHGSIPVVQIITKLLVRQQINFIPSSQYISNDPDEIGRLVITSFFAVPDQNQTPFHTYKLVTIPFFHENEAIQLAYIPRYWAFNPTTNTSMEWQDPQEFGCDLRLMTSCRDNPPIRKTLRDTCFDEIIGRRPLSKCHTIPVPTDKHYVQHLRDNLWITSSPEPMNCVKVLRTEHLGAIQPIESTTEAIILPSVSLINVTEGYAVLCSGFTLLGRPSTSNISSLVILYNNSMPSNNISVLNIHKYITENMTWFKNKITEQEKRELMDFQRQIDNIPKHAPFFPTYMQPFGILSSSWLLFALVFIILYYFYRRKRKNSLIPH